MKILLYIFHSILLLILFSNDALSQKNKDGRDLIFLKDGSIYIGQTLEETKDYYDFVLTTNDTIQVLKALALNRENYMYYSKFKYHKTRGFFWSVSLALNADFNADRPASHLEILLGHRFNKRWSMAGGTGFEFNRTEIAGFQIDTQFSSYFLYNRFYFNDHKKRFFAFNRIGFATAAETEEFVAEHTGGFMMQNGIGIHFASRKKMKFVLSLCHYMQETEGQESFIDDFGNEISTEFDIWIHRSMIKFGIEF